jgi:hypothetical protein
MPSSIRYKFSNWRTKLALIQNIWAAALLHDIGKAVSTPDHAKIGTNELEGILSPHTVWLIRHHLDLLTAPRRTRRLLHNTPQLRDLELLRAWDLKGRSPHAIIMAPFEAINILIRSRLMFFAKTLASITILVSLSAILPIVIQKSFVPHSIF